MFLNQNTLIKVGMQKKSALVFFLIALAYFLFPTNNSTLDSYVYAAYVKYNHYLFTPHHLFSNVLIYILIKPLHYIGVHIDILLFSKYINSLFQLFNLWVFYKILSLFKYRETTKLLYILSLAFSFSLWRYGTENEAYIVPITFSLLSSLYFLKHIYTNTWKYVFVSSLFGVVACLFHQIHFFWWFGLLIGFYLYTKQIKTVVLYLVPAILVPIFYILVVVYYEQQTLNIYNLQHFVLHDFYQGTVDTNFGWKAVFFQILNSIRTFFQVHPNIYLLIKNNILYILPLVISIVIGFMMLKQIWRKKILIKHESTKWRLFVKIHFYILVTNFLFAFYNYGNVEFMVMLPYLLAICISALYFVDKAWLTKLVLILFIWNFFYGILPNHIYNYYNDKHLVEYMVAHKDQTYIIKNPQALNQYVYATGLDNPSNIKLYNNLDKREFDSLVQVKKYIYTDVVNKPEILNKEKMTATNIATNFDDYRRDSLFSYRGFYGVSTVYRLSIK